MSRIVPLIRAAALVPMVRWLQESGRPVEARLAAAGLGYSAALDPDRPVPARHVAIFFRNMARAEGPDIGCRVISTRSVLELAALGKVALGAATPRAAIARVIMALPCHCTHETISVAATAEELILREYRSMDFDDETLHVVQQFVAAMVRALLAMTGTPTDLLASAELTPHPAFGLDHLRPWLRCDVKASARSTLVLRLPAAVADRPFPVIARDRITGRPPAEWQVLRGDGSLTGSARHALAAMLDDREPTLDRLAEAAGMSPRTLQRRLAQEESSFSAVLESVRRDETLRRLVAGSDPLADLAASVGYSRQSALTRAVRRWTGRPPSLVRSGTR